jgi:hypothetical protein
MIAMTKSTTAASHHATPDLSPLQACSDFAATWPWSTATPFSCPIRLLAALLKDPHQRSRSIKRALLQAGLGKYETQL